MWQHTQLSCGSVLKLLLHVAGTLSRQQAITFSLSVACLLVCGFRRLVILLVSLTDLLNILLSCLFVVFFLGVLAVVVVVVVLSFSPERGREGGAMSKTFCLVYFLYTSFVALHQL